MSVKIKQIKRSNGVNKNTIEDTNFLLEDRFRSYDNIRFLNRELSSKKEKISLISSFLFMRISL